MGYIDGVSFVNFSMGWPSPTRGGPAGPVSHGLVVLGSVVYLLCTYLLSILVGLM